MTEILFYHLTESKLEDALPPLLDKSVERGWRVAVQMNDTALRDKLDGHLWTFRDDSFLAHGLDGEEMAEEQPVLLTLTTDNVNGATVRTGDLYASGTISGPNPGQAGSFIELSQGGKVPVQLEDGSERTFLADGDTVTISATAPSVSGGRLQLGDVTGTIVPAKI